MAVQSDVKPSITALAFSHVTEGVGVNVIATGHSSTGVIRLWSTLDLIPLRDLSTYHAQVALTSIAFTFDARYLYASFEDGYLVILESSHIEWYTTFTLWLKHECI